MPVPRTRTKTFDHTISGLLAKRADLLGEAVQVRARLAGIRADAAAMDGALNALGYSQGQGLQTDGSRQPMYLAESTVFRSTI